MKLRILLGVEYVPEEGELDSERVSEKEDARNAFVDRKTVRTDDLWLSQTWTRKMSRVVFECVNPCICVSVSRWMGGVVGEGCASKKLQVQRIGVQIHQRQKKAKN